MSEEDGDEFPYPSGTRIELELEGRYSGGGKGVFEYLRQTALANPHAQIRFTAPGGQLPHVFVRAVHEVPSQPREIQPHPYGVELGTLMKMLGATKARRVSAFLKEEFCRVSDRVAAEILKEAGLPSQISPKKVVRGEAEKLHAAMNAVEDHGAADRLPRPHRRGGDGRGAEEGGGGRLLHGDHPQPRPCTAGTPSRSRSPSPTASPCPATSRPGSSASPTACRCSTRAAAARSPRP